jgi:hypothetical protein
LPRGAKYETDPVVPVIENVPMPGFPGTDTGKIVFDAADAGPEPTVLRAFTEQLYTSPPTRPVTVIGLDPFVAERVVAKPVAVHVAV